MDLNRVATLGHSFGGGTAGEAARVDARIKATLHLDAYYQSATALLQNGVAKPFLYAYGTELAGNQTVFDKAAKDAFSMQIRDMRHVDFADHAAWIVRTDAAGRRGVAAMNACMLSFLNKYLKGQDDGLLDNPSAQYPEVLTSEGSERLTSIL
jgi:hypothetical protein